MSSFVPSATAVHKNSFGKFRHTFTTENSAPFGQYHTRAPDGGIRIAYCPPPKPMRANKRANTPTQQSEASDSTNRYVLAERFRTRLCRNFVTSRQTVLRADGSMVHFGGSCPYEAWCMFAHGEEELRTPLMNVEDGLLSEEAIEKFKRQSAREAKERAKQQQKQQRLRPPAENKVTSVATPPSPPMVVSSSSSSLSSLELRESPNQLSEDEEKPISNAVIAVVFSSTTTPCNNGETSNNSTAEANAGSFSASEGGKDCQCDNDSVFNSQSSIDAGGCSLAVSSCDGDDSSCADQRTNEEDHWDISKCFGGLFGRLLESQC